MNKLLSACHRCRVTPPTAYAKYEQTIKWQAPDLVAPARETFSLSPGYLCYKIKPAYENGTFDDYSEIILKVRELIDSYFNK